MTNNLVPTEAEFFPVLCLVVCIMKISSALADLKNMFFVKICCRFLLRRESKEIPAADRTTLELMSAEIFGLSGGLRERST